MVVFCEGAFTHLESMRVEILLIGIANRALGALELL